MQKKRNKSTSSDVMAEINKTATDLSRLKKRLKRALSGGAND